MQFGICAKEDKIPEVTEWGFDYIEIPVNSYAEIPETEFSRLKKKLHENRLPCPAGNFFFAPDMRLTGEHIDLAAIKAYINQALRRAAELGCKKLVVGSGSQRNAPAGFPLNEAVKQFGEHLFTIGEAAGQYGIYGLIESIRPASCNILQTLEECRLLMIQVQHPNIRLMADYSQMRGAQEPLQNIVTAGPFIEHIHLCNSKTIRCPLERDEDDYDELFSILKAIHYCKDITVETHFFEKGFVSANLLRNLAAEYGLI